MGSSSDASITAVVPGSLQPSYVQSGFPERDFLINTRLLDLARDMSKADSGNTLLESSANQTDSNEDKPFSQCPKRSTTFEEGSLRDVHIIDSSCIKKPPAKREGVTSKQERELGKRRLSKCGVENWNEVYKVLFPGEPLPCSLYIERPLSAELIEFRNHALLRGPTIGEEIVREHLPDALRKHQHEVQTFFSSAYPKVVARLIESWTSETVSTSQSPDHQQTISSPPGRKAPSRKAPGRPSNANGITTSVSSNSPSRWNSALGNSVIGDMPTGNSQQRRHTRAQELTCQQQSRSLEEQQYQQQEQQQHPQQQRPYHRQPNVPAATYETQDNFNPTFDMYSQPHVQTYIGNSSSTSQTWQPPPELVNQFYTPNMGQPFQTPSSPYDLDFLPSMPATDSETSYLASDCFFELGICDPMGQ
ncbi:hypothetical protein QQS21_000118 [Conoideocrella luteorostrata]|uniref:Uncharacterized protein n=1 Tax=Conoideocrella luteorostrata TaxID=1105319 RepID=A0AAJ0CZQ5_9HYPO|nr:hypothetical protein QQS21_000118 [Conoideocrella luteorostrata]